MPASPPSTSSQPVRRVGRSLNVAIQVILFIIVIISANYLSCARHERIDLTERKDFTLSQLTTKYLQSDPLQKRDTPLKIIAIIRRSSPHYSRIYNLLDEYKNIAGSKLQLEFIDPLRQTDRTLEIENTYYIPYSEDIIIIDGRAIKKEEIKSPDTTELTKQNLTAHVRSITVNKLFITDERKSITAWQDEDIVTSNIIGALEGTPRKFYFAADKSDLDSQVGLPAWQTFRDMLWQQNIILSPVRLAEISSIPEDAAGFAMIGPQYDLDEKELSIVQEYWDRKQSAIFVTLDPKAKLDRLRIFLRNYGITPRYDRIINVKNGQTLSNVQSTFTPGSQVNQDLGNKSTIFDGSSCSLEVREADETLVNRAIRPLALIQAGQGWWGETRYMEENPEFNVEEDTLSPLYLSAGVIRGDATSDETMHLVSKMIVISNTDFLSSKKTRPEQADFVKSSINWLIGRDHLIGIGPKKLFRHKITILDAHNTFISRIVLIFLPAIAILTALIVWNTRRA